MELELLPPGYDDYSNIVRAATSAGRANERLKAVYYIFDIDSINESFKKVRIASKHKEFLLESERILLDKFIDITKQIKVHKKLHFIKVQDCEELVELSLKAIFERAASILDKIISKTKMKKTTLIEDKLIFAIRSNLRLIETICKKKIDVNSYSKFKQTLYDFAEILKNITGITASAGLREEEANAFLDSVISSTLDVWESYNSLESTEVPQLADIKA